MKQHVALYRKWRPLTFSDVAGQEHVTGALRAQVENNRLSHAYLFTGTRGTGKTTCAKILARAACCEHPVDGNPCNVCTACRAILSDSALDVSEIDAASNNGVDNIRDIREEVSFSPSALQKRVYIIDEVHMLSPGAFNALLKTLEDPPAHALFILATTEIHKVPATILSRCQRYDFRRIPPEIIARRLQHIADSEGYSLLPDAAALLARLGDGSMRDAISLLDRSLPPAGEITANTVTAALGVASSESICAIFRALAAGDAGQALALFTDCYLDGRDIVSLFDELLSLIRDLYILHTVGRQEYLLSACAFDLPLLQELQQQSDPALLEYFTNCITDLLSRLSRTAIKRTDGEMCLLKMAMRHSAAPQPALSPVMPGAHRAAPVAAAPTAPKAAPAPAAKAHAEAPVRTEAPTRTEAPAPQADSDVKAPFLSAVSSQLNSAVRTYLNLADFSVQQDVLHIAVLEESLIFMDKPAVLQILRQGAQSLSLKDVKLTKKGAEKKPDPKPINDILENARQLGITIK